MAELPRIENLVPDPSAEGGGYWGAYSEPDTGVYNATKTTEWAWVGAKSGKFTPAVVNPTNIWVWAYEGDIPVTAGTIYSASGILKTNNADIYGIMSIIFFDASMVRLTSHAGTALLLTAQQPTKVLVNNILAPATAAFARVEASLARAGGATMGVGATLWVDGFMLNEGSEVATYVDGSLGTYHGWNGAAHGSISYREAIPLIQTTRSKGVTYISTELWQATKDNVMVADITPYALSGKMTANVHNAIKTTLALSVIQPAERQHLISPYVEAVAPFITLEPAGGDAVRYQLGLFTIVPPPQEHKEEVSTAALEGRDMTWLLDDMYFPGLTTMTAGANLVTAAKNLMVSLGLRFAIPDSAAVATETKVWGPDKSYLTIINDLLNLAGYYTCWADRLGIITSRPYFVMQDAEPSVTLFSGEGGNVLDTIRQEGVYEGTVNQVIVYKENALGTPIIASRINDDPTSPTSTVALGRVRTRVEKNIDVATQAVADALCVTLIEEAASFTDKFAVTTYPMPERELHEVYNTAIYNAQGKAIAIGKYWCDGYELPFTLNSAMMVHRIKRLERYGSG